jgi:hypothetical protein
MLHPSWDGSQWCNIRQLKKKIISREFNNKDLGFIFQAWTPIPLAYESPMQTFGEKCPMEMSNKKSWRNKF